MAATRVVLLLLLCGVAFVSSQGYNYGEVLYKSLLFYQAQRSGRLSSMDPLVSWRKDSALQDSGNNGEDLTGGYYDAGDFVKFGFPMAFTMTTLAWGVITWEAGYSAAGQLDEARRAIRWGTDYLLKAHPSADLFYGQVGDGNADHAYWGRPEDMTMARPASSIDASRPGSDLAGESAAALAAASMVFRSSDPSYADTLLNHARQLFDLANNHRGLYSDSMPAANGFYTSSSYGDELAWAAAWLHRATGDASYLSTAEALYAEFGLSNLNNDYSWNAKQAGVDISNEVLSGFQPGGLVVAAQRFHDLLGHRLQVKSGQALLSRSSSNSLYKGRLTGFCNYLVNDAPRTPQGLIFFSDWGSLRTSANLVFICLDAADQGINTDANLNLARDQMSYILGKTGRSFVVGFGENPPTHPHHRSSSCPDAPEICDYNTYSGSQPNYHVLYGALVGGPDSQDNYVDSRQDYQHNEVALDYNAAFQGIMAALVQHG